MRACLDTNAYIDFLRGRKGVRGWVESAPKLWLPNIVDAEIRCGILRSGDPGGEEAKYQRFLELTEPEFLLPDRKTGAVWASLWSTLRGRGLPIPHNDVWIAALCVQHDLVLLSRDEHFDRFPGFRRVGWDL